MKLKITSLFLLASLFCGTLYAERDRYVGGDISLLPTYEEAKSKYLNSTGQPINDLLSFCYDEGMNIMRVRLFVDPDAYIASHPGADKNARQSLEYIIPLCQRIQQHGLSLMLDFHYSDTWADPAAQWTPEAWKDLTDLELYQQIYDYTKETLQTLKENGVYPEFIQPGNEISYGMLWGPQGTSSPKKVHYSSDANWNRFFTLLRKAIQACREECPEAKIILHTERVAQVGVLTDFYNRLKNLDYDIIGLSYYPYFHGTISVLDDALTTLETTYPEKDIMIVETGYSYAWEVPGTNKPVDYPYSATGQNQFAKDLVDTLLKHETCTGLVWWWMEYNAYGSGLTNWYNAPLFDSRNGRVTPAFATICSFGNGHFASVESLGDITPESETDLWFDLMGRALRQPSAPGIYIHNGKTVLVR